MLSLCLAAIALLAWLAAGGAGSATDPARVAATVRVVRDGEVLLERPADRLRRLSDERLRVWLKRIPRTRIERRGRARLTQRSDRAALLRGVRRAAAAGGGTVRVVEHPIASELRLAVVKQALRNNCETAALSMLLADRGIRAGQLELQRQLPRSGPLDPITASDGTMTWGDPSKGFVGRPEGGGVAGGYGVYARPIRGLAARRGVQLSDLTGSPARRLYDVLMRGLPVMVWIGLSDGPYNTWRTPQGQTVTGNFGEHTVVLTGIRGDFVRLNDPLTGQRLTWSKEQLELMWGRLGRRALAAQPAGGQA